MSDDDAFLSDLCAALVTDGIDATAVPSHDPAYLSVRFYRTSDGAAFTLPVLRQIIGPATAEMTVAAVRRKFA